MWCSRQVLPDRLESLSRLKIAFSSASSFSPSSDTRALLGAELHFAVRNQWHCWLSPGASFCHASYRHCAPLNHFNGVPNVTTPVRSLIIGVDVSILVNLALRAACEDQLPLC